MKKTDCGFEYETKLQLWRHRIKCETCALQAKPGAPSKPGGWTARCGVCFITRSQMKDHQKECHACKEQKSKNIVARNATTNRSEAHKAAAGAVAKVTARRPEIIAQRSQNLANWRENNPEEFAKSTEAAQKAAKNRSKAEMWMSRFLGWGEGRIICGNTRKQVDFVHGNVWIEVDGFWHFFETKRTKDRRPSRLRNTLALRQSRDVILNQEALRRGNVTLLRFSSDCFERNGEIKAEWLPYLTAMLQSPKPGVWCYGKLYESVPWADGTCTILKSPTPSTTFCSQAE